MFVIFESNGGKEIGLMCKDDGSGQAIEFNTREEAHAYAEKNCAFNYATLKI
jgi:hypothetical protein